MTALLSLRSVSLRYQRADRYALQDVSLTVNAGEFIAITGASGSGKSTLLNILGLLERPGEGEYAFDGHLTSGLSERQRDEIRSTRIGFIFQNANVLGDESVFHNVELGMRLQKISGDERELAAQAALESVDLRVPMAQKARLLSGGEAQRLAIARALCLHPDLILADEPTGNLDSDNGRRVIRLLGELHAQGHTIVLITHDPAIADHAQRRVVLRDGRIVSDTAQPLSSRAVRPDQAPSGKARGTSPKRQPRSHQLLDAINECLRSLLARSFRSSILLLAFMFGIAGLIVSQGLSQSAAAQVNLRLTQAALDGVTAVVPAQPEMWEPANTSLSEMEAEIAALPRVQGVAWTAAIPPADVRISRFSPWDQEPGALSLAAAGKTSFSALEGHVMPPAAAALLSQEIYAPVAVLGPLAAEALGIAPSTTYPGISIWIEGQRVPVVGVVSFASAPGLPPEFDNAVFVSRSFLRSTHQPNVTFHVRTEPGYPAVVAPAIGLSLDPAQPGRVTVRTVADLAGLRVGVSDDLGRFSLLLAVVVLILACLAGAVAMYLSVNSRTAEIALRRSLGSSRLSIFRLFVLEGLTIGLLGGAIGAVTGQLAALAIAMWQQWQPILPTEAGIVGIVVGSVCGLITSAYPAVQGARQPPAQALRAT